jgi:hypothetical protein
MHLDTLLVQQWPLHDSLARLPRPRHVASADTTLIYIPLLQNEALNISARNLENDLRQMTLLEVRVLYTPIPLPRWADTLLVRYGMALAQQPGRYLATYQPTELTGLSLLPAWIDANGSLTRQVRMYYDTQAPSYPEVSRSLLLVALLLGLALLVLIKLLAPQAFEALVLGAEGLRQRIDTARDPVRLAASARQILWLFSIVAQSFALLFWLRLNQAGQGGGLQPSTWMQHLAETSLSGNLPLLALLAAIVISWDGLRLLISALSERIFQLGGLSSEVQRANILGSYPLWPAAFFVGMLPFLQAEVNWGVWATALGWLLLLAFAYKLLVLMFTVVQQRKLHPVGRLLYICSVEVAPLLVLFS